MSGLVFVRPNIPVRKYGRDMKTEAANTFIEFIKGKLKDIKLSDCRLFADETLLYTVAIPDKILLCSCREKAFVEVKCPGETVLKKFHKKHKHFAVLQIKHEI